MYNKECRREIDNFFVQLNNRRNNLPSALAIYNLLETFSYDRSRIGTPIGVTQEEVINQIFATIRTNPNYSKRKFSDESSSELELIDKRRSDDLSTNYKYVDYRNLVVRKEEHRGVEPDDLIWLHFSILPEQLKVVGTELARILNDNNISFHLRMPNTIGPDAIVIGLFSKHEANLLLETCQNNRIIQDSITINNPFMPHRYGIGVVKETRRRSYTKHLSQLIHEYATNSKDRELTFKGFCRYVSKLFNEGKLNRTYQERYLDYVVALGIFCIYEEQDFLDNLVHLPQLVYKKEEFDKYRVTYENGEYKYSSREVDITSDNYCEWLKLQAYNCIQRMYYEQNGELPKEDFVLGETITGAISSLIDTIMRAEPFQVTSNYRDAMINDLYPYLVGYFAYEAKMTTEEEIKNVVAKVKNRMVTKLKVDGTNKNFYQVGDKTIQSTIPPIRVDNILVGIEYLDYDINYCNVFIYHDDNVKGYLGIFLDVERDKIWEENDIAASMYRASVARALCNFESLQKENITRGAHEGTLVYLTSDSYVPEQPIDEQAKARA